jgi:hypothetical protein
MMIHHRELEWNRSVLGIRMDTVPRLTIIPVTHQLTHLYRSSTSVGPHPFPGSSPKLLLADLCSIAQNGCYNSLQCWVVSIPIIYDNNWYDNNWQYILIYAIRHDCIMGGICWYMTHICCIYESHNNEAVRLSDHSWGHSRDDPFGGRSRVSDDFPELNSHRTTENHHKMMGKLGKSTISMAIFNSKLLEKPEATPSHAVAIPYGCLPPHPPLRPSSACRGTEKISSGKT